MAWIDAAQPRASQVGNRIIDALPPEERQSVLAQATRVSLLPSQVLSSPGQALSAAYFLSEGLVSQLAPIDGQPGPEVGMIGRDGVIGGALALGADSAPLYAVAQCPSQAWRIEAGRLRNLLESGGSLAPLLHRYLHDWDAQVTLCAACLRFHQIEPRLARWFLMCHDRVEDGALYVTHQSLAQMLGVRRVGITRAAGNLQRQGLIEYRHGQVRVLDRAGLADAACSCYAAMHMHAGWRPN